MRSALVCVLALGLLAVVAGNAGPAAADAPQGNLVRSLPIARAAWPHSRCAGREQILITNDQVPPDADGVAILGGACRVRIRPLSDPYDFCTTLVHELGHLAETLWPDGTVTLPDGTITDAKGHTHDNSIMDPDGSPNVDYIPCESADAPITARQAAASLADLPTSACRFIANKPGRRRVYRCGKLRVAVDLDLGGQVARVDTYPHASGTRLAPD